MNTLVVPDVASQSQTLSDQGILLKWVGMQGIALPVRLAEQRFNAYIDAGVSLDMPDARRIHLTLLGEVSLQGFHLRVVHMESLHAHDAVAESAWNWGAL